MCILQCVEQYACACMSACVHVCVCVCLQICRKIQYIADSSRYIHVSKPYYSMNLESRQTSNHGRGGTEEVYFVCVCVCVCACVCVCVCMCLSMQPYVLTQLIHAQVTTINKHFVQFSVNY